MKLATFAPAGGAPRAGEVRDGVVVAFDDRSTVVDRLASGDLTPAAGEEFRLDDVELRAPIAGRQTIFAIGLNYALHVAETGNQAPEQPIVFVKVAASAAAPGATVRCPPVVSRLDYEGELTIVMGDGNTVAGYCVADDVSARDLQRREPQWTRAKGGDGFCPYGPWITTADEIADPHALALRTWVNGELRQDGSTSDLIFDVPTLVAFIAQTCTMSPGDLILTGTPSGVGAAMDPPQFLADGDVVRIEIEGLGTIEHSIAVAS
jgi:acylpyruvate hydrolase